MDLTLHQTPANAVRAMSPDGVTIGDQTYQQSLMVSADQLNPQWAVTRSSQLAMEQARELLAWQPEIVILGTGQTLEFPPTPFAAVVMAAGVGLESMDNAAACRTYSVLLDEGRNVMLALIWSGSG